MRQPTRNRAQLLSLFLTNPDQAFYLQEVGRIVGKKPGTFQRTINNMENEGILVSEYRGNARYFRANKQYPLYKELRSIVFKTSGVAGSIQEALGRVGDIEHAFIYGSYARDKDNYMSDVDLLIIGECDEDKLVTELDRLERRLQREINYTLYTLAEFKRQVNRNDPFLRAIQRDRKVTLAGDPDELRKVLKG